jgi:hypothetical protein
MKHAELTKKINLLITQRDNQLHPAQVIDKRTYWSNESYSLVAKTRDLRYDFAEMMMSKWPGAESSIQWVKEKLQTEFRGRLIDYGRGENKLTAQFPEILEDPELFYHYDYFHTPNADHYPLPKSMGGTKTFDNCIVRPKTANIMRQNFEGEALREALLDTIESYNVILKN